MAWLCDGEEVKGVTVTELPDKLTLKTKINIKSPNKTTNAEAFQKYLTELCGVGVGYVFDQTSAEIKGEIDANRLYMSATGPKYLADDARQLFDASDTD